MLAVKIDPAGVADLHVQVASQIRRAIADGEAGPGDRLPPANDLAAELGVNSNTVLRALRALRDEGLLEFRRGRGITVARSVEHNAMIAETRALLNLAERKGYTPTDLITMIQRLA
jgi:GntR family transcriptional regulator